jgi:hypothetical protein
LRTVLFEERDTTIIVLQTFICRSGEFAASEPANGNFHFAFGNFSSELPRFIRHVGADFW